MLPDPPCAAVILFDGHIVLRNVTREMEFPILSTGSTSARLDTQPHPWIVRHLRRSLTTLSHGPASSPPAEA